MRKLSRQLMSRKVFYIILNELGHFGSIPFFIFVTLAALYLGSYTLFERLAYSLLISITLILIIKGTHYKDRPQKEEFSIFLEKVIASSFPSSHSMNITILTILISMSYPTLPIIITLSLLSFTIYLQRYLTRKHFIADIIGGICIGIAEVIFVVRVL